MKNMMRIINIIAFATLIGFTLAGCRDPGGDSAPNLNNPVVEDYTITGTGPFTYDGTAKTVTVTAQAGKSPGAVTVLYNGNTTAPVDAGTYAITLNVAAVTGWNEASGLAAGNLLINKAAGAEVLAPTQNSVVGTAVTLNAVTAPDNGQTVEYARNTSDSAPSSDWQNDVTFTGLTAGTHFYFFARAKENNNYNAGAASGSTGIATEENLTVYYWVDDIGGIVIEMDGEPIENNTITVNSGESITFTADDGSYTSYIWTLNGNNIGETGASYTFGTADKVPGRNYIVGLVVEDDENFYYTQITVKIEN